ncbi:MAG: tail fiber domain-containing protein, partial [Saprospiraceae bacterium]
VGTNAGLFNTEGGSNVFIGMDSGRANTTADDNTFVGKNAGLLNTEGASNSFFGKSAGDSNTSGGFNTFIGFNAGSGNTNASSNTFIGSASGSTNSTGTLNTFIGDNAGSFNMSGSRNTYIGVEAGNDSGDNWDKSIAIGYQATVDCNNCAVIGGTSTNQVNVGIGTSEPIADLHIKQASDEPTTGGIRLQANILDAIYWNTFVDASQDYSFAYQGNLRAFIEDGSGSFSITSDKRFKKEITSLGTVLDKVQQLKPAQYYYKNADKPTRKSWGFIAQEVEEIFPEIVTEKDGYKTLVYDDFAILAIKAIQELSADLTTQQNENAALKEEAAVQREIDAAQQQQINELKSLVEQLLTKNATSAAENQYVLPLEAEVRLAQNQPNPFRENTLIDYFIPANIQHAFLQVTAQDGTVIGTVQITEMGKGQVTIQSKNYPAGTYFYSLILDGELQETKRMILTK